jgi:hypothetical protein
MIIEAILIVFMLIREYMNFKERDILTKKLMAKNLTEYASFEIIEPKKKKAKKEEKTKKIPF